MFILSKMDEAQKLFVCSVAGCSMRFINEDHLNVHKKKHDMVLNFGNGQKTSLFVADQTPTPTRFIRNCEEVGLFQDLQNVNPFEETFRKAVEATREGSSHLEVASLHMTTADDTLHTPHVFPNITEENPLTNLISSTAVETEEQDKAHSRIDRDDLERLEVSNILHSSSSVVEVSNGANSDIETDIEITEIRTSDVKVIKQEADTSQHMPPRASSSESANKIPVSALSKDTVQVVIRLPDGQLIQLSGVSVGSIPSAQLPIQVTPPVVQASSLSQSSEVSNVQIVQNLSQGVQASTDVHSNVVNVTSSGICVASSSGGSPQSRLSAAKMKLKQRIEFNSKQKSLPPEPESSCPLQKKIIISRTHRTPSSDGSDSCVPSTSYERKSSNASEELDVQKLRFRERNRAAAMRCREKRKHWISDLEKRADETQRINQQLNAEVAKLRNELLQLKTLLLAHKDCSVTKAMQQGVGNGVARSPSKISPAVQLQVKPVENSAAPTLPVTIPVTLPSAMSVSPSPEEPSPKMVVLSKRSGLKQRRQAAAALTVSRNGDINSKEITIQSCSSKHRVNVGQPVAVPKDSSLVSGSHLQQEVIEVMTDNSNSTRTCVSTPTSVSGVPLEHGVPVKPTTVPPASYFISPKVHSQSMNNFPQVIKLNPSILEAENREVLQTNIVTHANGDSSMDSVQGSDKEVMQDIPSKNEKKS